MTLQGNNSETKEFRMQNVHLLLLKSYIISLTKHIFYIAVLCKKILRVVFETWHCGYD